MARLNKIAISLCALLFTSISLTPLAHASGHTHASATPKAHPAKGSTAERKKKATQNKSKSTAKTTRKKTSSAKSPTRTTAASQTALNRQVAGATKKCVLRKGYKKRCKPVADEPNLTIADAHKARSCARTEEDLEEVDKLQSYLERNAPYIPSLSQRGIHTEIHLGTAETNHQPFFITPWFAPHI